VTMGNLAACTTTPVWVRFQVLCADGCVARLMSGRGKCVVGKCNVGAGHTRPGCTQILDCHGAPLNRVPVFAARNVITRARSACARSLGGQRSAPTPVSPRNLASAIAYVWSGFACHRVDSAGPPLGDDIDVSPIGAMLRPADLMRLVRHELRSIYRHLTAQVTSLPNPSVLSLIRRLCTS
jgi:hypothetical protein